MIEKEKSVLFKTFDLGLYSPRWERAKYPDIPAVGRLEAETFEADKWTTNYPNAAFLNRLPDDDFWAAKQVMAFTPEQIAAMVETGQYTDPAAPKYITETLVKRRDKIGREFFAKVLPLDRFEVRNGELQFEDLAVKHGFAQRRDFEIKWSGFDNRAGVRTTSTSATGSRVPQVGADQYVAAEIRAKAGDSKTVIVYLRGDKVVGVDRTW
jgi:hypothetical protein